MIRKAERGAPYIRRSWRYLELQFRGDVTQTRMLRWYPHWLLVGYTRTMLAGLLLQPRPARIGIIGLGGGAQARFCHRFLPHSTIEVVENDPGVLALRRPLHVPADDARFSVELGDGAEWIKQRRGRYDLLLVDGYDIHGIPPVLASQRFHDDCAAALTPGGVMASNWFAADVNKMTAKMRGAFAERTQVLSEPGMENRVAFGWGREAMPQAPQQVLSELSWLARRQLRDGLQRFAASLSAPV